MILLSAIEFDAVVLVEEIFVVVARNLIDAVVVVVANY